jgi:two-component system OmpR family sensor kinase
VVREASGLRPDVAIRIAALDEVTVKGDSLALQQVLLNLIDNALRVSPPEGTVTITLQASGGESRLSITDQGPGIEPQQLERIFDRFYTQHNRTAEHGGAGLGLAIARAIANDHDGQLNARNEAGSGATFTLILPVFSQSASAPAPAASDRNGAPESERKEGRVSRRA